MDLNQVNCHHEGDIVGRSPKYPTVSQLLSMKIMNILSEINNTEAFRIRRFNMLNEMTWPGSNQALTDLSVSIRFCWDSTSDVTDKDQLKFIMQYLTHHVFFQVLVNSESLRGVILLFVLGVLQDIGNDIYNGRCQCYDNAANMSGIYN